MDHFNPEGRLCAGISSSASRYGRLRLTEMDARLRAEHLNDVALHADSSASPEHLPRPSLREDLALVDCRRCHARALCGLICNAEPAYTRSECRGQRAAAYGDSSSRARGKEVTVVVADSAFALWQDFMHRNRESWRIREPRISERAGRQCGCTRDSRASLHQPRRCDPHLTDIQNRHPVRRVRSMSSTPEMSISTISAMEMLFCSAAAARIPG